MLGTSSAGSLKARRLEIYFVLGCLTYLIFQLWSLLLGETTVIHDALNHNYPLYHYLAHSIIQGKLPLWNPYTHAGEPFYPLLVQMRLFEPLSVAIVWVGAFFTHDTLLLFNWDKVIHLVLNLWGVYLLMRRYARSVISRLVLFAALCLSSFFVCTFRQDGFLSQFVWAPFIALFFIRIVFEKDYRWKNYLALALFLGLRWQSYWFVGSATFLLFALVALVLFYRAQLWQTVRARGFGWKLATVLLINAAMATPNAVLFLEKDRFDFPLRANEQKPGQAPKGTAVLEPTVRPTRTPIKMDYQTVIQTGSNLVLDDYLQTIAPANPAISSNESIHGVWGTPSEACLYFGTLCWFIALLGFFFSNHPQGKFWLLQVLGFGLLALGPLGGLHRMLFPVFPPMWFLRNCHTFVLPLVLALFFFLVVGMDKIVDWMERTEELPEWKTVLHPAPIAFFLLTLFAVWLSIKSEYPENLATPYLLFLSFGSGWAFRRYMARITYFACLIGVQALLIVLFQKKTSSFLLWFFWNGILPCWLFFFCLKLRNTERPRVTNFFLGIVLLLIVADLAMFLNSAWPLYRMVPRPDKIIRFLEPVSKKAPFPVSRQAYEYAFVSTPYQSQAMRYHSLLVKRSAVLTPIYSAMDHRSLKEALKGRRFGAFLSPKRHSDLVFSGVSPRVLEEIFGINRPLLQFRETAVSLPREELLSLWEQLSPEEALRWLDNAVFLEGKAGKMWVPPRETTVQPRALEFTENSLTAQVTTERAGYLVWLDGADPYWEAKVDGILTPIRTANGYAKAVKVPPGTHTVQFDYRPLPFLNALLLFYVTFLLAGTAALTLYAVEEVTLTRGLTLVPR